MLCLYLTCMESWSGSFTTVEAGDVQRLADKDRPRAFMTDKEIFDGCGTYTEDCRMLAVVDCWVLVAVLH